jgi:serine phosphatase RsbU (regulator of sigma subunit)
VLEAHAAHSCTVIHDAIQDAVAAFTEGAAQSDDITLVVLEFGGAANGKTSAATTDGKT